MPFASIEDKRRYQREWTAKRRADFFEGRECALCGSTENLELDHLDPTTKVSHRIWNWAKTRRDEELAKCQVLCHECHHNKTFSDYGDMFHLLAEVSKDFICSKGHDLHKVGWYTHTQSRMTQSRCRYCIYLRDAQKRNYREILSYEEFIVLKGQDKNFSSSSQ